MAGDQIDWMVEEENLAADFNYLKRCHVTVSKLVFHFDNSTKFSTHEEKY